MSIKRIAVLTGGGDCPGLNAVIRAVTKSAILEHHLEVLGVEDGFLGLIEDRVRPLGVRDVSNVLDRGGTILGTSNKADPAGYCTGYDEAGKAIMENVTDRVLANLERHGIDALVCIGGDGTMSAASAVASHGPVIIGVPKTIDNDVYHTDVTFGFDTAVATASDALDRIRTTASSHHRVMLVEMMGRYAGWLTLHAGLAGGADVVLIPEIPYDIDLVCESCDHRKREGKSYTLVAVSEGALPIGGQVVVDRVIEDSPDPIRLGGVSWILSEQIADKTGLECRATILGHVQRGGKPTAHDRVLATRFGVRAVEMLVGGESGKLVTFVNGRLSSALLAEVAGRQRLVPPDHPLVQAARALGTCFGDRPCVPGSITRG